MSFVNVDLKPPVTYLILSTESGAGTWNAGTVYTGSAATDRQEQEAAADVYSRAEAMLAADMPYNCVIVTKETGDWRLGPISVDVVLVLVRTGGVSAAFGPWSISPPPRVKTPEEEKVDALRKALDELAGPPAAEAAKQAADADAKQAAGMAQEEARRWLRMVIAPQELVDAVGPVEPDFLIRSGCDEGDPLFHVRVVLKGTGYADLSIPVIRDVAGDYCVPGRDRMSPKRPGTIAVLTDGDKVPHLWFPNIAEALAYAKGKSSDFPF